MGHQLATVTFGPVLFVQGKLARRRIPRLPEPPGERAGVTGRGPALSLLVVGDSAAAGVGAPHQDQSLTGHIVRRLAPTFRVQWTLLAETGATTVDTIESLRRLDARFDLVVTSVGVNDVTSGVARAEWRRRQRTLRDMLTGTLGASHVIVSGLPPVGDFPALPQPLRWYLGRRAAEFDRDLERDVQRAPRCTFLQFGFPTAPHLMAPDGFHPGPAVYAQWGRLAADLALDNYRAAGGADDRR